MTSPAPSAVLAFWREAGKDKWYTKNEAFDAEVRERFLGLWQQAAAGELASWETTDDGALALVIVLDQFPRNMFRGDARTFSTDAKALARAATRVRRLRSPVLTALRADDEYVTGCPQLAAG